MSEYEKFEDNPSGGRYDHAADDLERSTSSDVPREEQKPLIESVMDNQEPKNIESPEALNEELTIKKIQIRLGEIQEKIRHNNIVEANKLITDLFEELDKTEDKDSVLE